MYRINSIDSCQHGLGVGVDMHEIIQEQFLKSTEITKGHGFDQKVVIMRKEEEATRLALRFSGLEHLVSIPFGTERVFDLVFVDRVHFTNLLELFGGILVNGYLLIDCKHSLIS